MRVYNRLQVFSAKIHACIQKTSNLNTDQKQKQTTLIDTFALHTLFTRHRQIIRSENLKDFVEALVRLRRELQYSYFET